RLTHQIPVRWSMNGPSNFFKGNALQNEFYVWQVGVWAAHGSLENVRLEVRDFISNSEKIDKSEITSFNQAGVNWHGKPIKFKVDIPENKVQALWSGIQIPESAKPGIYKGKIFLTANNLKPQEINVEIKVADKKLTDKGDSDLWRHARLRWLN